MEKEGFGRDVYALTHERVRVTFDVKIPEEFDKDLACLWLRYLCEEPLVFNVETLSKNHSPTYLSVSMQMASWLYQLAKLPIFDIPEIEKIKTLDVPAGLSRVNVLTGSLTLIPQVIHEITIKSAFSICHWISQNPYTEINREKICQWIQSEFIDRISRYVPFGNSTMPVLKAAHRLRIPFIHLGLGVFQLGWGSRNRRLDRSATDADSVLGSRLVQNKNATANLLRMAGFPAPYHHLVADQNEALAAAKSIGFPLVVKPVDQERGEGISIDVSDNVSLISAIEHAFLTTNSKKVLVERQVAGVCHRFFMVHGKLLYAVVRYPLSVFGDGTRTVRQLVDDALLKQHALPPWRRSKIFPIDELAMLAMTQSGFDPDAVPKQGERVPLRKIESTVWGGVDEDVTSRVAPANIALASKVSRLFNLDVAGIDMISVDISKPWYENGAVINEVNFSPLLGGAPISRSYIPQFLAEILVGDGKIPVNVFNDGAVARQKHTQYVKGGLRSFFVTPTLTLNSAHESEVMPSENMRRRILALLCRADVDAIVISLN